MKIELIPQALERALIEWRTRRTRQRLSVSLNEFAAYLGYSRPIVSQWLNGDKLPSKGTAELIFPIIVELLGVDAYKILDVPLPDPDLQTLTRLWPSLNDQARHSIIEQAEKYAESNEQSSGIRRPVDKTV